MSGARRRRRGQCSGVLIAPTIFATAGHCGVDRHSRLRQLRPQLATGGTSWRESLGSPLPKEPDLAVVVLDAPARSRRPHSRSRRRPSRSRSASPVTSVGFGYSSCAADGSFGDDGLRRFCRIARAKSRPSSTLVDLNPRGRSVPGRFRWARSSSETPFSRLRRAVEALLRHGRGLPPRLRRPRAPSSTVSARSRNARLSGAVEATWRLLLAALLVLMIPGLLDLSRARARRDRAETSSALLRRAPSQQPSLNLQRGHCQVPWRHSIAALQRRHRSTAGLRAPADACSPRSKRRNGPGQGDVATKWAPTWGAR